MLGQARNVTSDNLELINGHEHRPLQLPKLKDTAARRVTEHDDIACAYHATRQHCLR